MQDLIARLEKLEGPSWEADYAIAKATGSWEPWLGSSNAAIPDRDCPAYTASIDAALTLVPDGQWWCVSGPHGADGGPFLAGSKRYDAILLNGPSTFGATPAIALCIAALRARAPAHEKPRISHSDRDSDTHRSQKDAS